MARCKNIGGGSGDDERRSPCLTTKEKDKGTQKVASKKKCKCVDIEAE